MHDFTINFRDECLDTVITPAVNDDVVIPLGKFFYEGLLQQSTQSLNCNPIRYRMFVKETTSVDPVDIYWNLEYNDYELNPTERDNRGDYVVVLQSCV